MIDTEWMGQIARIVDDLDGSEPGSFPESARQLHALLCTAAPDVAAAIGLPCRADRLERLLRAGAMREAAFELLGRAQYMMSRSGAGHVRVEVLVPDLFPETKFTANHEAIALTGALAEGLRDWARAMISLAPSRATH